MLYSRDLPGRALPPGRQFLTGIFCILLAAPVFFAVEASTPPLPLPLPELPPLPQSGGQPAGSMQPDAFRPPAMLDPNQVVFEIPPVFQRPLGVDEGGRVFVREFVVTGVIDDPEAGILLEEIDLRVKGRFEELNGLLAKLRVKRQNQENVGPDGFTPEEREAIIDFMSDVVRDLSPDRQMQAYQSFVDQLRLQRLERNQGLTIGQMQLIADEVTRHYRDRGFFLARAVIPAQEVVDGVVVIRVLEGRLGSVQPDGNRRYSASRLTDPFRNITGQLVTVEKIEDALLTLQDYPGLSAVGVFQPGAEIGTADMLVNVSEEDRFDFMLRADNHGTRFTGENRLLGDFSWNSPFHYGDKLQITALQTYQPDNSVFGALKYQLPLKNPHHKITLEATHNTFAVADLTGGGSGTDAGGVSDIVTLSYDWQLTRTRAKNTRWTFDLSRKVADTETFGEVTNRDQLAVFGAAYNFEKIDAASATIVSAYGRLDYGLDGMLGVPSEDELLENTPSPGPSRSGNEFVAASNFSKLTFGYSWLKSMTANQTLLFRVNGQYTPDVLASLEQFVIGGPASVRALPSSQHLTDYGAFASAEWGIRAPGFADKPAFANRNWGDVLRFTLFYDHSVGYFNLGKGQQESEFTADVSEGGFGLGIEFGLPGTFTLNLQAARRNGGADEGADETDPSAILDDTQYWLDFTWQF